MWNPLVVLCWFLVFRFWCLVVKIEKVVLTLLELYEASLLHDQLVVLPGLGRYRLRISYIIAKKTMRAPRALLVPAFMRKYDMYSLFQSFGVTYKEP